MLIRQSVGHEKGAFTGATHRKIGILESARGGSVYLDELHHLDLPTQGKLLRALRENKIRRVGGLQEEPVNFRLIASTWPNIEDRVKNGTFLPDLYYRLKFLSIEIPPLRDRPEDIEPLVAHYCEKHFQEKGVRKRFLKRTIRYLEKHSWPGNVGELDGYIAAVITDSASSTIDETLLDRRLLLKNDDHLKESTFAQLETRHGREKQSLIQSVLQRASSVHQAADRLGMKPSSLHTLITRYGMRENFHDAEKE